MTGRKEFLSRENEVQAGGGLPPEALRLLELNGCLAVFITKQYKLAYSVFPVSFSKSFFFLFSHVWLRETECPEQQTEGQHGEQRMKNKESVAATLPAAKSSTCAED